MRRVTAAIAATLVAVLAAGWLALTAQARALGRPLVNDAVALEARRFSLPGDATGSLTDCLGAESDVSPDLSRSLPWLLPAVRAVAEGTEPVSALPLEQRAEVDAHRPWLERVLRCASRREVAAVAGLGPFADVSHGRRQTLPRTMDSLATLAPVQMREALARGAPAEALETCAAVFTLTTAWLRLEGLEAMLATFAPTRGVKPACRDAVLAASTEERAAFAARLKAVRELAPEYAELMQLERTQLALRLFGAWLPVELDGELPPAARAITRARRAARWDHGVVGTLALRLYWKRFERELRAIEAAARQPSPARERDIVAAQLRLQSSVLERFFSSPPVDLRYQMYAGYLDALHADLEQLPEVR